MCPTNGNSITAINKFIPVCAIAIRNVSPLGKPSDTNKPANQIVPVVPKFAPRTAPIAAGSGNAPLATKAMIAVVDRLDDCQSNVMMIPPKNMYVGLPKNHDRCSMLPIDFIPPENVFNPM